MHSLYLRNHGSTVGGITLLEVLVAIFIAGIGLLAILTLFPLGALELAQAIKDDRQSQLHDVADDLLVAGAEIETSAEQMRGIYAAWLQEQHAPPKEVQTLAQILKAHDDGLADIAEKVRSRLPNLTDADRQLALRVLHLIRNGRSIIRALQQNLRLVRVIQQAQELFAGPGSS